MCNGALAVQGCTCMHASVLGRRWRRHEMSAARSICQMRSPRTPISWRHSSLLQGRPAAPHRLLARLAEELLSPANAMALVRALPLLLLFGCCLLVGASHPEIRFEAGKPLDEGPDKHPGRLTTVDITLTPARIAVRFGKAIESVGAGGGFAVTLLAHGGGGDGARAPEGVGSLRLCAGPGQPLCSPRMPLSVLQARRLAPFILLCGPPPPPPPPPPPRRRARPATRT